MRNLSAFIVLLFSGCFTAAIGQVTPGEFGFSVGAQLAIPASNLSGTSIGAGIDLTASYGLAESLAATADAGYTGLFGKDNSPNISLVPIRAGVRYFLAENIYAGAKIGLGILSLSNVSTNYTAYSIGAGYRMSPQFDIGASYDGYTRSGASFGYAAVRLGYNFGN